MRSLRLVPILVVLATSLTQLGCRTHERADDAGTSDAPADAASTCLPLGDHSARVRVENESPPGCTGMSGESVVTVPLPPEFGDLGCGSDAVRVTATGPCTWDIEAECAIPDSGISLHGTVSGEGGEVHGRIEERYGRLTGECSFTIVLGDG